MVEIESLVLFSGLLFALGIITALLRRSLIAVLIGIELMLAAANLTLVGFSRAWVGRGEAAAASDGQVFAFVVIAVAIAQIAMGVGILIAFHRHRDSLSIEDVNLLQW